LAQPSWFRAFTHLLAAIILLAITSSAFAVASPATPSQAIDLAQITNGLELTQVMSVRQAVHPDETTADALAASDWQQARPEQLTAPRRHSTLWLQATVTNTSDRPQTAWLVFEPWRLNRVDGYFLATTGSRILWHETTGLVIPKAERTIANGETIIPVALGAGERQRLLLKVYSDSLPFLSIQSWNPDAYTQSIRHKHTLHTAIFAGIATLFLVLLFQLNVPLLLTGTWLLVAFIFEAEKDGFFSLYLVDFLDGYALQLRASSWIFTEYLFLVVSVFLLGLQRRPAWRRFLLASALPALAFTGLTFTMDGSHLRNLGIGITSYYSISWLFMVPAAFRYGREGRLATLWLLAAYWFVSVFLLTGYIFNFYYTATFAGTRIYAEILIALALVLTYTRQKKYRLRRAEQALRQQEANQLQALEQAVEERTRELNSALDTARKASQAKVDFLGQVTHDLRSPLTAILGYAQLQNIDPTHTAKANQIILDRAGYMLELVNGLLDYAHDISTDKQQLHDLYLMAFTDSLVHQAHILAGKNHNRFQFRIETDLPTVIRCNSTQLQRILLNLLDNAAKYTQNGDIILSVAFSSREGQDPAITFRVQDTGIGISEKNLKTISQPYYQVSDSNPGVGLGLSICFELARNMGGKLHLDSELGKGTTATCSIPYMAGDEQRVTHSLPVARDLLPAVDAGNQSAWIVEDSRQIRDLLEHELSDMGFQVELAYSAEQFLKTVSENTRKPAVIVTDYQLQEATGDSVLLAARRLWPDIPVILLSATYNASANSDQELPESFSACLAKPVDLLELRLKLAELCHLQEAPSPA